VAVVGLQVEIFETHAEADTRRTKYGEPGVVVTCIAVVVVTVAGITTIDPVVSMLGG